MNVLGSADPLGRIATKKTNAVHPDRSIIARNFLRTLSAVA
jgi:hypothetical protein